MSGDHNQYQKDKSYLDFECPRCGHCCQGYELGFVDGMQHQMQLSVKINKEPTKIFGPNLEEILNRAGFYKKQWVGLTEREVELIDEMIETQLLHAERCDHMANSTMAQKQKAWDLERVELLRKLKEKNT